MGQRVTVGTCDLFGRANRLNSFILVLTFGASVFIDWHFRRLVGCDFAPQGVEYTNGFTKARRLVDG